MYEKELEIAILAAQKASLAILQIYNSNELNVEIKSDNSPVTKADKLADKIIRDELHKSFPTYSLLTEESVDDLSRLNNDYVWVVDPIDGTKDFIAHDGEFSVNIALVYKHVSVLGVILSPVTGDIYYATSGKGAYLIKNGVTTKLSVSKKTKDLTVITSHFHTRDDELSTINKHKDVISKIITIGSSLKGCVIASGLAELSYKFSSNTKEWDTAAMQIIIEEAGGHLVKLDGKPVRYNKEDVFNRGGYLICNSMDNFLL